MIFLICHRLLYESLDVSGIYANMDFKKPYRQGDKIIATFNAASKATPQDAPDATSNQLFNIPVKYIFWQQTFFLILQDLRGQHPGAASLPAPEYEMPCLFSLH